MEDKREQQNLFEEERDPDREDEKRLLELFWLMPETDRNELLQELSMRVLTELSKSAVPSSDFPIMLPREEDEADPIEFAEEFLTDIKPDQEPEHYLGDELIPALNDAWNGSFAYNILGSATYDEWRAVDLLSTLQTYAEDAGNPAPPFGEDEMGAFIVNWRSNFMEALGRLKISSEFNHDPEDEDGSTMTSPSAFDEDTYRQAKPYFEESLKAFQEAGKSLKDLFKLLIQAFGIGVKPYAVRFAQDMKLTADLGSRPSASNAATQHVVTDLRFLNAHALNKQAALLLSQIGWTFNPKTELAVAQLMLWILDEDNPDGVDEGAMPVWASVTNFSDHHQSWREIVSDLERRQPGLLMRLLAGEDTWLELDGMNPSEAATAAVEQLISSVISERPVI